MIAQTYDDQERAIADTIEQVAYMGPLSPTDTMLRTLNANFLLFNQHMRRIADSMESIRSILLERRV